MNYKMDDKTLKLLADPHKLKIRKTSFIQYDNLRYHLECKFDAPIRDYLYTRLLEIIESHIIVDSVLQDIINQVTLSHNP